MTSKTRALLEREAIDEQHEPVLAADVKKLRKRLFKQSERIKKLVREGQDLRALVRSMDKVLTKRQKAFDELLHSSIDVIASLKEQGYYDKKEKAE